MFDNNGKVVGSNQWISTPVNVDSGRVQSWINGDVVMNQVVTAQGEQAAVSQSTVQPDALASAQYKKGDWWGTLMSACPTLASLRGLSLASRSRALRSAWLRSASAASLA